MSKTLFEKIADITAELKTVGKDGRNDFQRYDYVSEGQILEAVKPLLAKHKVGVMLANSQVTAVSAMKEGDAKKLTTVQTEWTIVNLEDPTDYKQVSMCGQGVDNGDKGSNKANTAAKKYMLMSLFLITTGEDPEKDNLTVSTKKKPAKKSGKKHEPSFADSDFDL